MDWNKLLTVEDLPESYQTVADLIGLENTLKLAEHYHGRPIYLARPHKLFKPVLERYVRDKFNGHNHHALSVVTGYTVRHIYKLVEKRGDGDSQQELELFDMDA